jgi:cytidyltransferase-like protein
MKEVLVFGTFDIFHIGHLKFLQQAKKLGDKLKVIIARDINVKRLKNEEPIHNENQRQEILNNLEIVDKAILGNKDEVYQVINKIDPDIIALGYDQTHFVDKLEEKLDEFGLDIKITRLNPHREEKYKSSKIKQKLQNKDG